MKIARLLAAGAITACLLTSSAFAAVDISNIADKAGVIEQKRDEEGSRTKDFRGKKFRQKRSGARMQKDPIKALESRKERIRSLVEEGKITKEKADEIIAKIDEKIKEIEEFNSLTLEQKREKLTERFKAALEKRVKEGKLTKEEADELMKKFDEKIKEYDGKGYPKFLGKHFKMKRHSGMNGKN